MYKVEFVKAHLNKNYEIDEMDLMRRVEFVLNNWCELGYELVNMKTIQRIIKIYNVEIAHEASMDYVPTTSGVLLTFKAGDNVDALSKTIKTTANEEQVVKEEAVEVERSQFGNLGSGAYYKGVGIKFKK